MARRTIIGHACVDVHPSGRVSGRSVLRGSVDVAIVATGTVAVRLAPVPIPPVPRTGTFLQALRAVSVNVSGRLVEVPAGAVIPDGAAVPDAAWGMCVLWTDGVFRPLVRRPRIALSVSTDALHVAFDIPTRPVVRFCSAHLPADAYTSGEVTRLSIPMRVMRDGVAGVVVQDPRRWAADASVVYTVKYGQVVA